MTLRVVPLTMREANALIATWHRHHKPVRGCRFAIGAWRDGHLVGACIVGSPVARLTDQKTVCEVTRLVTDGTKNACSILYAASARAARSIGYAKIQTFILAEEPGTSLLASGWTLDGHSRGGAWTGRPGRRSDQPTGPKTRWARYFPENVDRRATN